MEYDWFKKEAKNKVRSLNENNSIQEYQAIYAVDSLLNPQKYNKKLPSFDTDLEYELLRMKDFAFLFPVFEDYFEIVDTNIKYNPKDLKVNFTDEDIIRLTQDFFKNGTNNKTYEEFLKLYNRNNIKFLRNAKQDFYAESFYLPYYKELYIQEKPYNEFSDVPTLAHEFGHGLQHNKNFDYLFYYKKYIFMEISSMCAEFMCSNYYLNDNEYSHAALTSACDLFNCRKEMNENIYLLIECFNNLDVLNSSKRDLKQNIKELLKDKSKKNLIQSITDTFPSNSAIYLIGYMIAIEIYNVYINDPDEALRIYDKIQKLSYDLSNEQYFEEILDLGIFPCEHLKDYQNFLLKRSIKK